MKKFLSLFLVLALCLSFSAVALADEPAADPAAPSAEPTTEAPASEETEVTDEEPADEAAAETVEPEETVEETEEIVETTETTTEEPAPVVAADPIEVTVTISVEGTLVLTRASVTAHDQNSDGVISVDEVLYFAHEDYYEGGAEAGYASGETEYGVSLMKLWGDESGAFGYCVDDVSAWSLADPVQKGQHVAAYVYADQVSWGDQYCFFNFQTASSYTGELTVLLSANGYDAEWNPVTVPVVGATLTLGGEPTEYVTDENGSVTIQLEQKGKYILSAVSESQTLVPPTALITVSSFADSCGHWAEDEIETVVSAGLFNGIDDKNFGVLDTMTRAQLVTVLYRLAGGPEVEGELNFADVKDTAYYVNAVIWASQTGITTGTAKGFDPNGKITREQLVTFLYRFALSQSMDTSAGEDTNILSYEDIDKVHNYALEAMQWAVGSGLIQGSGSELLPAKSATRAEVAVVLARVLPGVPMPIGSSMAE